MASKNVETLRAAHQAWNNRDFEGTVRNMAEAHTYTDHARNLTLEGRARFREWAEAWAKAFSDAKITDPEYIDAGDVVIARFTADGTNDGPFAGLPATGRRATFPFCEVVRFDRNGKMAAGHAYYDQYTIFVQLGHIKPLAVAA